MNDKPEQHGVETPALSVIAENTHANGDLDVIMKSINANVDGLTRLIGKDAVQRVLSAHQQVQESTTKYPPAAIEAIQAVFRGLIEQTISLIAASADNHHLNVRIEGVTEREKQLRAVNEALRQRNEEDPLTGLFNKGALEDRANTIFDFCEQKKVPLSCLFIDLDYFKKINDELGHAAGDAVLKAVSAIISHKFRKTDLVGTDNLIGRDGGEEFVVFLPYTSLEQATKAAELLRMEIQETPITIKDEKTEDPMQLTLTCTIGVAEVDFEQDTVWGIEGAKGRADIALRTGKEKYRNITVAAGNDDHGKAIYKPVLTDPNRRAVERKERY